MWRMRRCGRRSQCPLTILLGEDDNDPNSKYLRRTPEALAQGAHRLARGRILFAGGLSSLAHTDECHAELATQNRAPALAIATKAWHRRRAQILLEK